MPNVIDHLNEEGTRELIKWVNDLSKSLDIPFDDLTIADVERAFEDLPSNDPLVTEVEQLITKMQEMLDEGPVLLGNLPNRVLQKGSDLNDITECGTWSIYDTPANMQIKNAPTTKSGKLYVNLTIGYSNTPVSSNNKSQRYETYDGEEVYFRKLTNYSTKTWEPWRQTYSNTTVRPVEGGGTGGSTVEDARNNLKIGQMLGMNPITTLDQDTYDLWKTKENGFYRFGTKALLGQPSQWGFLYNLVYSKSDIVQFFISASSAKTAIAPIAVRHVNEASAGQSMPHFEAINSEYQTPYVAGTYTGRDIAGIHSAEIGSTPFPTWFSNRIKAGNFEGININDYVDIPIDGTARRYRIGDIDPWYLCADQPIGHHIVMIPDQHWILSEEKDGDYAVGSTKSRVAWNTSNDNNGSASENHPYLGSNLHKWEIEKMLPRFPKEWQDVMLDRRALVEERYGSSGKIQDSNNWSWANLGKLWSLSEIEIYGHSIWGTKGFSEGIDCQLAIFKRSKARRLSTSTWLRTPASGSSTNICYAVAYGYGFYTSASTDWVYPRPCFLVG